MNRVASPVAPSERIRGAASEPATSQPQYLQPEGGRRHGIWSGTDKEEGGDDDKRSRRARLDGTGDLSRLTTAERRFKGLRGTRASVGVQIIVEDVFIFPDLQA